MPGVCRRIDGRIVAKIASQLEDAGPPDETVETLRFQVLMVGGPAEVTFKLQNDAVQFF